MDSTYHHHHDNNYHYKFYPQTIRQFRMQSAYLVSAAKSFGFGYTDVPLLSCTDSLTLDRLTRQSSDIGLNEYENIPSKEEAIKKLRTAAIIDLTVGLSAGEQLETMKVKERVCDLSSIRVSDMLSRMASEFDYDGVDRASASTKNGGYATTVAETSPPFHESRMVVLALAEKVLPLFANFGFDLDSIERVVLYSILSLLVK